MSTETVSTGSESFSPGEAAYFKSRGTDTAALEAELGGDSGVSPEQQQQAPVSQEADSGVSDDGGDGEEHDMLVTVGPDGKPRNGKGQFVPQAALHKERERRKATETELLTTREKMARADERLTLLNEILGKADQPAPAAQAEMPNPETDPIGALQFATKKIQALESEIQNSRKAQEERDNSTTMLRAYERDAESYARANPDFLPAYEFLKQQRHAELEAMGFDANARRSMLVAEERNIVSMAFQNRRSPSELMHNLAKARGFKAAPTPEPQVDPMKKIETIANGQRTAGVSLTNAGGTSGEGLTAEALANMSEEEFAAVSRKVGKAKMAQLLGG